MRKYSIAFIALFVLAFTHTANAQEQRISYFNSSLPDTSFFIPLATNVEITAALGERMTLSTSSGFVDSISIVFDSIVNGDSIEVALVEDTLYQTTIGWLHQIDLWNFSQPSYWNDMIPAGGVYWSIGIPSASVHPYQRALVPVPHIAVPQNFFVLVVPRIGGVNCEFAVAGDTEAHVARMADNTRANLISYNQALQDYDVQPLDSAADFSHVFYYGDGIYSNLNIAAYVQEGPASVSPQGPGGSQVLLFPNPASSFLQVRDNEHETAILKVCDLLGRTLISQSLENNRSIDVHSLEPGRYEAIIEGSDGVHSIPFIIQP